MRVNPLLELNQRNPFSVTLIGVAGGIGSMILDEFHAIAAICTTLLLLIALGTKIVSAIIALRAWRQKKQFQKRWNRRDPADDHLIFDERDRE
jgi:predicted lipid-binding transport protein (Tim44 family)